MQADKKEKIIDALQVLFQEGKGGSASVSEIAKKAGIAKGGMYYYFHSKEEVLEALIHRQYDAIIARSKQVIAESNENALFKFALLLKTYRASYVDSDLDYHLHQPQNAAIHQKSLATILTALTPIVADIITQGVEEKLFICPYPKEYAEIVLSVFTFLLDPGIFTYTLQEQQGKLQALALLLEKGLGAKTKSFAFLYMGADSK